MIKIIKNRKFFLPISGLLVSASIVALFVWGLNFGIDFKGGSLLEVEFGSEFRPTITEIQDSLAQAALINTTVQPTEDSYIIRFKESDETIHLAALNSLKTLAETQENNDFKELRFDSVGPSIGKELKSKSFNASLIALLMIIIYISFSFRKVSLPVASWKYGVASIIALAHDVIITLGIFSFLGYFYGTEINTPFIAAILTILGYSINDSIVVFDRIRDNLPKSKDNFADTVDKSLNQTLGRSLNTSLSTVLALLAIYFFGGDSIKDFALALIVGILSGTFSSIFIASPILVIWDNLSRKKRQAELK
ncbi:protein translocase subunit SecF [Patescibacteria group bacterium]|nr:protein translocase subunit SecF [Patescibacteria group bacterium]